MHILIATGIYPPDIGGPATYSKILADELPKHGIETKILSFGCVRCLPKIIRHIVYFLKVLKFGKSVDLIFALDPVSVGLPSFFAAKILRKKFALKIVGDYAWEMHMQKSEFKTLEKFQTERYDFITELRRKIERCVAKGADKIIVPSQYLKKIVLMWKVKEEKINVINNSFELPAFTEKLDLPGFNIVSVGRLVPWKGFQALEEIILEIKKEIPDIKLHIINNAPHEEVLKYLHSCDIFILNTGYEGFSHQILEAMAIGIPVITTSVGGNLELIEHEKNGLLVNYNSKEELKNAILRLYKNKDLRENLIKNAHEKVKQFNKEKMIKETIRILSF